MKKFILLAGALFICLDTPLMAQTERTSRTKKRTHNRSTKHRPAKKVMYYNQKTKPPVSADESRPSPYKGDETRSNDGVKKNEHRNMNYNSGQPLPANNGSGK